MAREHRVPLSPDPLPLLQPPPRLERSQLVVPAPRGGELSDMTLSASMKRLHDADTRDGRPDFMDGVPKHPAVPHGMRSTFRDRVSERTTFPAKWPRSRLLTGSRMPLRPGTGAATWMPSALEPSLRVPYPSMALFFAPPADGPIIRGSRLGMGCTT